MRGTLIATRPHHRVAMDSLSRGMIACGDTVADRLGSPDFVATWGGKVALSEHLHELPRLYLEAGYINGTGPDYVANRLRFVSFGWNGMHNKADPITGFDASRWDALDIRLMPWRRGGNYALVLKQHPGDSVARNVDYDPIMREIHLDGWRVRERDHPIIAPFQCSLDDDLRNAAFAVTYSSTAAVESVIAGVPVVALDRTSIATPVSSQRIVGPRYRGDRKAWANELAFRQWTLDELSSGEAWAFMRGQLERAAA